jgi:hypothetical protein
MNPAFSPETSVYFIYPYSKFDVTTCRYALVWDETTSLYQEMMETEGWIHESEHIVAATNVITQKVPILSPEV